MSTWKYILQGEKPDMTKLLFCFVLFCLVVKNISNRQKEKLVIWRKQKSVWCMVYCGGLSQKEIKCKERGLVQNVVYLVVCLCLGCHT